LLRLLEKDNCETIAKSGKTRKIRYGYYGFLREIGNKILEIKNTAKKEKITNCKKFKLKGKSRKLERIRGETFERSERVAKQRER
jgi:hypothetical protein